MGDLAVVLARRAEAAEERRREMMQAVRGVHDEMDGAEQALDALARHKGDHESDLAGLKDRVSALAQRLRALLPQNEQPSSDGDGGH